MASFYQKFKANSEVALPPGSMEIKAIDMHTGGEPLRVITEGYPEIPAASLLDYRRKLMRHHDHLRTALMFEPRGHADMYGALILPPFAEGADCSTIFLHNEGYSSMCGHAVIAIMTLAMQMDWVEVVDGKASMVIEAPCGLIHAKGTERNGQITAEFECVPSFVAALNQQVYIESVGKEITYDVAYGGAFYAYVDARQLDLTLDGEHQQQLINLGKEIKVAVNATSNKFVHPFEADLSFNYGTIFIGGACDEGSHSRNVCIFADGEVDRSPTGSGVSGRMALHFAKAEVELGQSITIESIIGSKFSGEVVRTTEYGDFAAVIPKISGSAHICGTNRFIISPNDPLKYGFLMR